MGRCPPRVSALLAAVTLSSCGGAAEDGDSGGDGGLVDPPEAELLARAVASSPSRACAITVEDELVCWGHNAAGVLGDGTEIERPFPVRVDVPRAAAVQIARVGSCAANLDGELYCWGAGALGQIGDGLGDEGYHLTLPRKVKGLPGPVLDFAITDRQRCAVVAGGDVYCWGADDGHGFGDFFSELCRDFVPAGASTLELDIPCRRSPFRVEGLPTATRVAVGPTHLCVLGEDGRVTCHGTYNASGQVGLAPAPGVPEEPLIVTLDTLPPIIELGAGQDFTCALDATGSVWCWGDNRNGGLGDGASSDIDHTHEPVMVEAVAGAVELSVGEMRICVRDPEGTVTCWGDTSLLHEDWHGWEPAIVDFGEGVVQLGGGLKPHCIIDDTARVRCRGYHTGNGLEMGWVDHSNAPVLFDP